MAFVPGARAIGKGAIQYRVDRYSLKLSFMILFTIISLILMNAMKRVTSVARMRLVQTPRDLTNASANMVSMVTATTAQVSQFPVVYLSA